MFSLILRSPLLLNPLPFFCVTVQTGSLLPGCRVSLASGARGDMGLPLHLLGAPLAGAAFPGNQLCSERGPAFPPQHSAAELLYCEGLYWVPCTPHSAIFDLGTLFMVKKHDSTTTSHCACPTMNPIIQKPLVFGVWGDALSQVEEVPF